MNHLDILLPAERRILDAILNDTNAPGFPAPTFDDLVAGLFTISRQLGGVELTAEEAEQILDQLGCIGNQVRQRVQGTPAQRQQPLRRQTRYPVQTTLFRGPENAG